VAQIFPAWILAKEPHHQFIGAAYAHTLAERNVVACRRLIQSDWYQSFAPQVKISDDQNQKDFFTTTKQGQYKGTGIGGTLTGFGANTILLDDVINPKEANSDTIRLGAIQEIRSTMFSRFNDRRTARMVLIMQRLHEADPTGELLKDGRFHLLKLPAEAKTQIFVNLGERKWVMDEGELLTPRLTREGLNELRVDLGEYFFSAQYMQEPVPLGGGEFKPEWIQHYGKVKHKDMNIYILCDPAGGDEMNKKKKKTSDWSAFMVIGLAKDNNFYLLDMVRDRLNPTERVETLFQLHRKWNVASGISPKVGYEKYGMMTDTHYIKEKQEQENYRFQLIEVGGSMAKEERIRRMIPDLERGRWWFPASNKYIDNEGRSFDLVQELINGEMTTFPRARHDDMLDAITRIYDMSPVFPRQEAPNERYESSNDDWTNW
jgi:predicted phage terminase large subunit-like protein